MDLGLKGRGALVGGASAGLGRAVAEALSAEGCRLVLWSRSPERLDAAVSELRDRHGTDVFAVAADSADPETPTRLAEEAVRRLGAVDIVFLNTGGPPVVDPAQTDPAAWLTAFQSHVLTPIGLTTALLPTMRARGWGRVVASLSSTIIEPIPDLAYSTSARLALAGWLKTLARSVAADGITVNGVIPGRIASARTEELDRIAANAEGWTLDEARQRREAAIPAGRYGKPEELAALVAFLCSEPAGYITGAMVPVDGGLLRSL